MPFLRNIGFLVTYRCQVSCRHCIIEAGPHRTEEMTLEDAFNWTDQVSRYRDGFIKVLSITGGEPYYNIEKLEKLANYAYNKGLIVSVVTNAYWASSPERALQIVERIPEIGMMAISTDVYHQEHIPFQRIENAVNACKATDLPYNIHICTESEEDEDYLRIMSELDKITDRDHINTAVTMPAGRALEDIDDFKHIFSEEPPISACTAGSSPIVFPNGRVIACIGPVIKIDKPNPLLLGDLRKSTLKDILDRAEENPILHSIRIWGPKKLVEIIREHGYGKYLPQKYIAKSVCDACFKLMYNDDLADVLNEIMEDEEFREKVAYARAYYLNEARMLEQLSLINPLNQ